MAKEAIAALGALVGMVIFLTLIAGGNLHLGTSPQGPSFGLGFTGPQAK
jgi:hypothetical protein